MYEAREKWRNIGGVFLLSESTLDNIDSDNRKNDDKLRKVIIEWLNRYGGTGDCTWTHVAMALRNKTVAREDVAREVLEQHPQPWSVPPPHTSPDSGSGATADTPKPATSHPQSGAVLVMCKAMCFTLALATLPVGSQFSKNCGKTLPAGTEFAAVVSVLTLMCVCPSKLMHVSKQLP